MLDTSQLTASHQLTCQSENLLAVPQDDQISPALGHHAGALLVSCRTEHVAQKWLRGYHHSGWEQAVGGALCGRGQANRW